MSRKIKIVCQYFNVRTFEDSKDAEAFDLIPWLTKISELSLQDRIKPIGRDKGRLDAIVGRDSFYALNFIRMETYSSTYIVSNEENAKHVDIDINEDEYIGKNTVALYDSEHAILMLMRNQGGFSAHTITNYINSFYEEPVCVLEPIKIKKDFLNEKNKFGKIELKISNVQDYVCTKGSAYETVLQNAKNMDAETFLFEFSVGRKKHQKLDPTIVRTIISDAYSNMGAVSIARVKMEDEEGTAVYNLFENVKNTMLMLEADKNGEIPYKMIAEEMLKLYS